MKMMLYVLPIVFFFVLYNVPSGLLVYWIMSNILTMVQQLIINRFLAKKRADMKSKEEPAKKVIVPPKKRKRR
jgi:YidC/Oxa1 family membrane protein insertase